MTSVYLHGELCKEWDWENLFLDRLRNEEEVQVYGMAGFATEPKEGRGFSVYFYSAPYPAGIHKLRLMPSVDTMFGIPVEKREDCFPPAYRGYVIHCPEGVAVAECVDDRHLYFFHNIGYSYDDGEFEIVHRVLDQYFAHRACSDEERIARAKNWQTFLAGRFASWYPDPEGISKASLETCRAEIDAAQTPIGQHLVSASSSILRYQLASEVDSAEFCQKILLELEQIRCLPQVMDIQVDLRNWSLVVYTKPLTCLDPETGKRHLIGCMQIHLNLLNSEVTWTNQDRSIQGFQAPGINQKGEALYERLIIQFASMLPSFALCGAARLALQYVEQIPRAVFWANNIKLWPLCEEEGR